LPKGGRATDLCLRVLTAQGSEVIAYQPRARVPGPTPLPATEPPSPRDLASADELYLTGLHLEQYRHATRCPTAYWREALRRDPMDARCHNAMGLWHLRRGEFAPGEAHFRAAIARLTIRNANPADGEAFYNLGQSLRHQAMQTSHAAERLTLCREASDSFHKAAWNQAWVSAARHALAELDCSAQRWASALDHLDHSLRYNADNTRARDLKAVVLRKLGAVEESDALLRETLALDPLDWWARYLTGQPVQCDLQTGLDIAHDCARAGLYADAIALLDSLKPVRGDLPDASWGAAPLVQYTLGWLREQAGQPKIAALHYKRASQLPPDYCHPARLEEIEVLTAAQRQNPRDARALYYLGNLFYDRRRHEEAIRLWERSAKLEPDYSVVWRNLGVGYFNVLRRPAQARVAYDRAFRADPGDARVLFERDQLWKRLGEKPETRLRELEKHAGLVQQRDDLSVELCALYNQTGRHDPALRLLGSRRFQPWEGGEGAALGQYTRAQFALGRAVLAGGQPAEAIKHFTAALTAPENLGEAKHLLANDSDVQFWLGRAYAAVGDRKRARACWEAAAKFKGDFQEMRVRAFSEMTYYSALAWKELGRAKKAARLLRDVLAFANKLGKTPAKIDYFATSLPTMLLFDDDLQLREETRSMFLRAQAWLGLGRTQKARALLEKVLRRDPNHALAADLMAELRR
jgi:tetratricopeptide (TPR) repeat protein